MLPIEISGFHNGVCMRKHIWVILSASNCSCWPLIRQDDCYSSRYLHRQRPDRKIDFSHVFLFIRKDNFFQKPPTQTQPPVEFSLCLIGQNGAHGYPTPINSKGQWHFHGYSSAIMMHLLGLTHLPEHRICPVFPTPEQNQNSVNR